MTPETTEWLSHKVPGFSELSDEEKNAIVDFSFLWGLFEGTKMDGMCNVPRIRQYVEQLAANDYSSAFDIEPYLEYLKNRYYKDGKVTHYFYGLHLERSGNPDEVLESLSNNDATTEVKTIGILIIVFRLRNNLFHGEKWQYSLKDQLGNFSWANNFLKCLLDL